MPDNARSSGSHRWARALFALGGLALVAALIGLATTSGNGSTGTEPVTSFDAATRASETTSRMGSSPPTSSAVAIQTPVSSSNPTGIENPGTAAETTTTGPMSQLAIQLGERGSAIPEQIAPRVIPTRLRIDDLYIDVPVRPVGLDEKGQLEIPDETEVGWYRYGAVPDRAGATVLAGHVTWNRTTGPFWLLRDLEPGARIDVELADGSMRTYEAVERAVYGKDELPRDRIWRNSGDETLVLITCGGDYNPEIRRYLDNVVVYAVPLDSATDRASEAQGAEPSGEGAG